MFQSFSCLRENADVLHRDMQRLTDQLACLLGTSCHESDPNHLSACEYLEVSKPVIADGTETISYAPCCFPQRDLSKACDTLQTSDNCFEHCQSSPNTFLHEHALPQGLECICFSDSPCADTSFDAGGCASPTSVFAEPRHQSFVFHSALPPPFICGGAVCQKVHKRAQVDHALSTISPPGFHLRKVAGDGNCLFSALALGLFHASDTMVDHLVMRQHVVQSIISQPLQRRRFYDDIDFNNYICNMSVPGHYGDELCISGFAAFYDSKVLVLVPDGQSHSFGPGDLLIRLAFNDIDLARCQATAG